VGPERPAPRRPAVEEPAEVEKLIDFRQVADYVGFVCRSAVRHKLLTTSTALTLMLLIVAVALLMPKTYHIEVKLLAQRNAVMAAISNPGRAVPWDADAPTRAAAETVLRRDNLISLVTQTDLINEWDRRRPPIIRFKDWIKEVVTRHEKTADEKLDLLIWRLENYMFVTAGPVGDGTVSIDLYWPDAETGYRIVERARQAYLEARQIAETSAISESIRILENRSNALHQDVNRTLVELRAAQAKEKTIGPSAPVSRVRRATPVATADAAEPIETLPTVEDAPAPDPEFVRVKAQLAQKREELAAIDTERQRQLSELQAKISALLTVYTATHPSVVTLQQQIASAKRESPQVAALQASIDELETKSDEMSAALAARTPPPAAPAPRAVVTRPRAEPQPEPEPIPDDTVPPLRNQTAEFASLRLRTELSQLQSILERTDGARIELAVSEAAFKYRYTVIKPAEVPREPESPNLRLILIAGLLLSVVVGVGAGLSADLISNRILEAWQVERQLGLPILGSVKIV
jgi:uncharacterized protein involved in exopolysaccharide biosynthesis